MFPAARLHLPRRCVKNGARLQASLLKQGIVMHREPPGIDRPPHSENRENGRIRDALEVLLEARERLLEQLTEEILSHREGLLHASEEDGTFSFELQEIEDRYSTRLSALNALLENLDTNTQPSVEHRVETIETSVDQIGRRLKELLGRVEHWDLVDFEVVRTEGDKVVVVVALARDEAD